MFRTIIGGLAALSLAVAAQAQEDTLGEILAKGAKKMSSDEVKAAVTGGLLNGVGESGGFRLEDVAYEADGGTSAFAPSVPIETRGEWTVDADGLQCTVWYWVEVPECQYWYRLGESIYVLKSKTEADRAQRVVALRKR